MNYSPSNHSPTLVPDLRDRREKAYRAFIGVVDAWIIAHDIDRDPDAELLVLAEQEITGEVMRQIYRVLTRTDERNDRLAYLENVPEPSPVWKQAARLGMSLLGRRPYYRPPALFRPDRDICTFHVSSITSAYAEEKNVVPCLMVHGDWFSASPDAATRGTPLGTEIEQMLTVAVERAFSAAELDDPAAVGHTLRKCSTLARLIGYHRGALQHSGKPVPKLFWSATMGFPLHRIMARAVLRCGGEVVSFDHGCSSGMYEWDFQIRNEFGLLSRFVTFSPQMAEGLRRNVALCGGRFRSVEIVSLAKPRPAKSVNFDKHASDTKLLYVSRSYWGENFMSPPLDDNDRLEDWQWRLLPALQQTGMEVGFKPHPEDMLTPTTRFRDILGVKVYEGKFEDTDWKDTIMVFDTTLSSTFPYALSTGLPIIVFDTPHVSMRPAAREILEKRVAIAKVWRDGEGRLQADWGEIAKLVERAMELRDNSISRTYYGIEIDGLQ